jgi:hypothetical protein
MRFTSPPYRTVATSLALVMSPLALGAPDENIQRVVVWGAGGTVNTVPTDLGRVDQIATGAGVAVARRLDGTLRGWGDSSNPARTIPATVGVVEQFALGWSHGVARRSDGSVVCWGRNTELQSTPPANLVATLVSAGGNSSHAIRTDGTAVSWGLNAEGQCNVPADLGSVSRLAGGFAHTVALRTDGTVRCWGRNIEQQCNVPASLTAATAVAAGAQHSVALRPDGTVAVWGNMGGFEQPSDATSVVEIAAGYYRTAVRRSTGQIVTWGAWSTPPASIGVSSRLVLGVDHAAVISEADCDGNGVTDFSELTGRDCNANFRHDCADAAFMIVEDCNGNSYGDSCEAQLNVSLQSPVLSPFGAGADAVWEIPNAAPALNSPTLSIRALGDLGEALETATLFLEGVNLGPVLESAENCALTEWQTRTISAASFNAARVGDGAVRFRLATSASVDAAVCPTGSRVEFKISYVAATSSDCNANGLLDSCEIAKGYAVDGNNNGVLDECEQGLVDCRADLNGDGAVDASDLATMLEAWGQSKGKQPADLDGDGFVGSFDLSELLNSWGACG